VVKVGNTVAHVELAFEEKHDHLSMEGVQAFPLWKGLLRWAVRIESDPIFAGSLQERFSRSQMVRTFGTDEEDPPLMTIKQDGKDAALLDSQAVRLFGWQLGNNALLASKQEEIVERLETIARAQHLLRLQGGTGRSALDSPLDIEWGRVEDGHAISLLENGASLTTGQSIYVSLVNTGSSTVYVSIFDIGTLGDITLLSPGSAGVEVPAGRSYRLGDMDFDGTLLGLELSWPEGVPKELPCYEALLIVMTSQPQDLRNLETSYIQRQPGPPKRGNDASELLRIVDQISYGGLRDALPQRRTELRYDIKHVHFLLEPPK
jgi:hypothetical protein